MGSSVLCASHKEWACNSAKRQLHHHPPHGRENLVQTARSQRTKNEGEGKFEDETQAVGVEKRKTGVISRDRHSKCSNKLMAMTRELVARSQDRQAGGVGGEQQ